MRYVIQAVFKRIAEWLVGIALAILAIFADWWIW